MLEELLTVITTIRKDLLLHFFCGYLIMITSGLVLSKRSIFVLVLLVAISKEIWDMGQQTHTPELTDIIFTVAPCLVLLRR